MVLQSITQFNSYSLFSIILIFLCLCHSSTLPVVSRVHDIFRPFSSRVEGGIGVQFVSIISDPLWHFLTRQDRWECRRSQAASPCPRGKLQQSFCLSKEHRDNEVTMPFCRQFDNSMFLVHLSLHSLPSHRVLLAPAGRSESYHPYPPSVHILKKIERWSQCIIPSLPACAHF